MPILQALFMIVYEKRYPTLEMKHLENDFELTD